MKRIGILGSGRVATALAGALAGNGMQVILGTRDRQRVEAHWTGPAITIAADADAARAAPLIINATPGDTSLERLGALRADLEGKIVLDLANATRPDATGVPGALCYPNSSLAEHLQAALPNTHVVKALNTMAFTVMVNPQRLAIPPTAFVSGNDPAAKAAVMEVLRVLGWPPDWITDLGNITTARGTEALMLLVPHLIRTRGFAPFALTIAS